MVFSELLYFHDWSIGRFLRVVLAIQVAMLISAALNTVNLGYLNPSVVIIRQTIGFIYLTFLPGMILIRIFRLHHLSFVEGTLYSVGLSISFSMLLGLFVNQLFPSLGITEALSSVPLLFAFAIGLLVLCILAYLIDRHHIERLPADTRKANWRLISAILSLLIINFVGIFLAATYGSSFLLILVIATISGLTFLIAVGKVDHEYLPLLIIVFALVLLFDYSMISQFPVGWDGNSELYMYKLVEQSSTWNPTIPDTYNSALSITILPNIYSQILNLDGVWIFKILYQFIYSLVPVGLYEIYRKQADPKTAFLSVFFFISLYTFFNEMPSLARQEVAFFFIVLLMLLMFDKKMNALKRVTLYLVFATSIVVSHYGTSYLYMICLAIALLISVLSEKHVLTDVLRRLGRVLTSGLKSQTHASRNLMEPKYVRETGRASKTITFVSTVFFFAIAFGWFSYTSNSAAVRSASEIGNQIYNGIISQFMVSTTRAPSILRAFGSGSGMIIRGDSRIVFYITLLLTAIGIILYAVRFNETKFNQEYRAMSLSSAIILLLCIALPYFAGSLDVSRIYHFTMLFLAPFCVLGGLAIFEGMIHFSNHARFHVSDGTAKNIALILVTIVLTAYFLYNTGFIYEVTGVVPSSVPLSMQKMKTSNSPEVNIYFSSLVLSTQDVASATWLLENRNSTFDVCADYYSVYHVLRSYGLIPLDQLYVISNETVASGTEYIYLSQLNMRYGILTGPQDNSVPWNTSEISHVLQSMNQIYSNGFGEIHLGIGQNP